MALTQEQRDPDEDVLAELVSGGASGARIEMQLEGPLTLISVQHTTEDLMAASEVLNLGKKEVVALRVGWTIKTQNRPEDEHLGDWIAIAGGLKGNSTLELLPQHIDSHPLRTAGTLEKLYITQVRFRDSSSWDRINAKAAPSRLNS